MTQRAFFIKSTILILQNCVKLSGAQSSGRAESVAKYWALQQQCGPAGCRGEPDATDNNDNTLLSFLSLDFKHDSLFQTFMFLLHIASKHPPLPLQKAAQRGQEDRQLSPHRFLSRAQIKAFDLDSEAVCLASLNGLIVCKYGVQKHMTSPVQGSG